MNQIIIYVTRVAIYLDNWVNICLSRAKLIAEVTYDKQEKIKFVFYLFYSNCVSTYYINLNEMRMYYEI